VGADRNVVTIGVEEYEHFKVQPKESDRNISQKQKELQHKKQRAIIHQKPLQEQLKIAIDRKKRVRQHHRKTQATLDQTTVNIYTSQDQIIQLEQQQQIDLIRQAADLQTAQAKTAQANIEIKQHREKQQHKH